MVYGSSTELNFPTSWIDSERKQDLVLDDSDTQSLFFKLVSSVPSSLIHTQQQSTPSDEFLVLPEKGHPGYIHRRNTIGTLDGSEIPRHIIQRWAPTDSCLDTKLFEPKEAISFTEGTPSRFLDSALFQKNQVRMNKCTIEPESDEQWLREDLTWFGTPPATAGDPSPLPLDEISKDPSNSGPNFIRFNGETPPPSPVLVQEQADCSDQTLFSPMTPSNTPPSSPDVSIKTSVSPQKRKANWDDMEDSAQGSAPTRDRSHKVPHKIIEARYRTNLNRKFDTLRENVPVAGQAFSNAADLETGKMNKDWERSTDQRSKGNILDDATRYISHLEEQTVGTMRENRTLKACLEALRLAGNNTKRIVEGVKGI